ncbi:hypothetical protein [Agrobacterium tumefaciens]|uniref:hypothetical protein n=1 Tax=Agrobacterium tumefaciens TaxID=358 RepID=UPI00045A686B|nr:hypothetical protein [Agrobacterium tumefaciens]CDN96065.1 hypothetical protein BN949_05239 [Agrobacterium tumefaciens]
MTASASTLDIDKFRKVHALMTGGATDGERAAAKNRCEAIAKRAGLTLNQAVKAAKAPKPQKFDDAAAARAWADQREREQQAAEEPRNIFEEIFNSPEMKAQRAERMAKNAVKRARIVKEYGSVQAVFKMTPWEMALRTAIAPFSQINPYDCEITGETRFFTQYLDGEMASDFFKGTDRARAAIAKAIPMPTSIGEAFAEIKAWNKLRWDRGLFYESFAFGYTEESEVQIRQRLIEDYLKTEPARSWQDLEDRLAWQKYEIENEYLDPVERDDPFMDRIEWFAKEVQEARDNDYDESDKDFYSLLPFRKNADLHLSNLERGSEMLSQIVVQLTLIGEQFNIPAKTEAAE